MNSSPKPMQVTLPKSQAIDLDSNLIPMINIVFLLLIFFMIAGQIQKPQPTEVRLTQTQQQEKYLDQAYQVTLNANNQWLINGVPYSANDLLSKLQQQQNLSPKAPLNLAVYVDQNATVAHLNELLSTLKKLEWQKVHLVTQKAR
ncbi:biopolymer transporter ExbD [Thiomicrorhabdus sp. Kp2]|uniref:ExbD/TolR family protein n=1 Tax=Thiomicrorhabdus sp. Kp2 TaxID=1123518 RepID=UPI0004023BFA|nr:biopolymer transporter ExbD [Thiomicrorhabdus sp. Kp2]